MNPWGLHLIVLGATLVYAIYCHVEDRLARRRRGTRVNPGRPGSTRLEA